MEFQLRFRRYKSGGFVLITEGEDDLIRGGDREAAEEAIEDARDTVESAVANDREKLIAEAKADVHRAEVAAEYNRYDVAVIRL